MNEQIHSEWEPGRCKQIAKYLFGTQHLGELGQVCTSYAIRKHTVRQKIMFVRSASFINDSKPHRNLDDKELAGFLKKLMN
jgi:hypothetical protein